MSEHPRPSIGYCTNVHGGESWEEMRQNLARHAVQVRTHLALDEEEFLPIGLWLSSQAARGILESNTLKSVKEFLDDAKLRVFTMNGFPYGNFHQEAVKHRVYEPDWSTERRFHYTLDLINIFATLLPEGGEGSISTLPLGWPSQMTPDDDELPELIEYTADNLVELARHLENYLGWNNKFIHLDLEPEPGCLLQRPRDVVEYVNQFLLGRGYDSAVRKHIAVCHDVCHAAVMFEEQDLALSTYVEGGVAIGKVQISSALRVDFERLTFAERVDALQQLAHFAELRYLHQTCLMDDEGEVRFFEDLPLALEELGPDATGFREARVHFHVPVHMKQIGNLSTTQYEIIKCLALLRQAPVPHYEIETYAWNVLPEEHLPESLAEGIAAELQWFHERFPQAPHRR